MESGELDRELFRQGLDEERAAMWYVFTRPNFDRVAKIIEDLLDLENSKQLAEATAAKILFALFSDE